jgi:hypothetical protein
MSSDIDSIRRITVLLERGIALVAWPQISPCIILHTSMAAGSSNVFPMV